jgi:cytochrome c55X
MKMQAMHEKHRSIKKKHYAVLMLLLGALLATAEEVFAGAFEITDQRKAEIMHLLKQDCGSCHGMTLKGGLGPALTPDALKEKPTHYLELTILEGRTGTPMPPWKNILSNDEVAWLVKTMKSGVQP